VLRKLPEVTSCVVSVLEPGIHIPIHVGYYKGIMRYMIPTHIPKDKDNVFLCVNGIKYSWTEGEGVLWDDTFSHKVYNKKDFQSNDGMLTTVWGPSTWHLLHTMSFNYPVNPSCADKNNYREFVLNLQYVLPCGKCRKNLTKNFKKLPLTRKWMENRASFSLYIYNIEQVIVELLKSR
jgi:aspartyl/asparaginyl beta-hydroxylase (cupin superfamily)